jgi:hypothetical protein
MMSLTKQEQHTRAAKAAGEHTGILNSS